MTLEEAARVLAAVSETPDLDARLLWEHAFTFPAPPSAARGIAERSEALADAEQVSLRSTKPRAALGEAAKVFADYVARRLSHEPVAYIAGIRGFWTIDVEVTPDVLIPRPDSETLLDAAVAHFGAASPRRILDLGTGSGALLLAALDQWPAATGLGIDASEAALKVARGNAARIAPGRAEMRCGDWAEGVDERFDLVLCNPPYVEAGAVLDPQVLREPAAALFAGDDGLSAYRALAPQIARVTGGIACIEIGWRQAAAVTALLEQHGLGVTLRRDFAGNDRCLVALPK
ncbi:MAG: peptide chain release factor N(5)-glutamine methyltransferase [Sphingomonadaceae bacterium]